MNANNDKTCADCPYCDSNLCKYNPPRLLQFGGDLVSRYPAVNNTDFCHVVRQPAGVDRPLFMSEKADAPSFTETGGTTSGEPPSPIDAKKVVSDMRSAGLIISDVDAMTNALNTSNGTKD